MTDTGKHDLMLPNGARDSEQPAMPNTRSLSLDHGLAMSKDLPVEDSSLSPDSSSGSKAKTKSRPSIGRAWKVGSRGKKTSKSFSTSGSPKKARVAALSRAVHSQPSLELYKTHDDGGLGSVSMSNLGARRDDGSFPETFVSSNVDMKGDKKENVKKRKIKVRKKSSKSVVNEDKIWHTLDTTSADIRRSAFKSTKAKRPVTLPPTFDIQLDPAPNSTEYTSSQDRMCADPDTGSPRDRLVCSDTSLNTRHRVIRRVSTDTSKQTDHQTDTTNSFDSEVRAVTGLPRHKSSLGLYLDEDRLSTEGREGTDTSGHARTAPPSPETAGRSLPNQPDSLGLLQVPATLPRRRSTEVLSRSKECDTFAADARSPVKISPKNYKRNEKFHKIFKNIPESEIVLKSYLCAFVGDILLQGYLYISPNFFCFYTKILGHEKQLEIPVADVVNITREKTALIIPNGIGIVTCKDKFVFGSLMNRDNSYRLMVTVWRKLNPGDDVFDTASDTEHRQTDLQQPEGDDTSLSSNSSDSICSECGTPMTEHEPGLACDNSPTCDITFDDEPLSSLGIKGTSQTAKAPKGPVANGGGSARREDGANNVRHVTKSARPKRNIPSSNFDKRQKTVIFDQYNGWTPLSLSFPKTNTLLLLYLAVLGLLVLSALFMGSKIIFLQSQFEKSVRGQSSNSHSYTHTSQQLYKEICETYERLQLPGLDKFQSALETNIDLLNKIQTSLLNLQSSAVQPGPCQPAPDDS